MLGIARSLAVYYCRPFRLAKLINFYSRLLPEDGLYFDIGAHVGHRVWAARKAGARAVAVEPQPACQPVLRLLFQHDPNVVIDPRAVAEAEKTASLLVSHSHPTVTSINQSWVDTVGEAPAFSRVRWSKSMEVEATTLDRLIETHGMPAYCKIDIEGGELAALQGLRQPIELISIERLPAALTDFEICLDRLTNLADYRFNWCRGETPEFASERWMSAAELIENVQKEPGVCDVFAGLPAALERL